MRPSLSLASRTTGMIAGWFLLAALALPSWGTAQDPLFSSERVVAEEARSAWENGAIQVALGILDHGIQAYPDTLALRKLRGDILATSRRPQDALHAYDAVLAARPTALDVRWAKWSVLLRSGQADESIAELRRMAQIDLHNPLIHYRLAQELRKVDHLEESLQAYQQAVALAPHLLGWRLTLARARFDVLDYAGAENEVQYVVQHMPPGSPLDLPARTLQSLIDGTSTERGRRHEHHLTPDATAAQLKEWSELRAEAWRLFSAHRYREVEPIYRRMLVLNAQDPIATYQLGLTLMQLGRCREALMIFRRLSDLDPSEDEYADSVFRMGQCLVELERWEDAYVHFQVLYDAAVEFEEANQGVELQPGTRVLDKAKLTHWLEKVRPHLSDTAPLKHDPPAGPAQTVEQTDESFYATALERLKPQRFLETRASLMGRDADFSWFRFVIPAIRVMRDDFPTGAHEFIPLNPNDSFPTTQRDIYLVFGLVSSSYDAVPLSVQCFLETPDVSGDQPPVAQDHVLTSMNDQSGYFMLSPPQTGWPPGLYRCGLFAGERTSAYNHVDEVRFRILDPHSPS